MWYTIVEVLWWDPDYGKTLIVIKSRRRFKPPRWLNAVYRSRKQSVAVRLSDLGIVLRESGKEYIEQYLGIWMRKKEFLKVMWCALLRSYKSVKTVERMMRALREFVNKPVEPKPRPRRPFNIMYELPPWYPSTAVRMRARRSIQIPLIATIYVFSKTAHIMPYYGLENRATVVIPLNEVADVEITEKGLNTLRDLLDSRIEKEDPEIAEVIRLAVALAELLS